MTRRIPSRSSCFPRISEEMHRLSTLLGEELLRWPDVSARPMFGMRAFYRKQTVFGLLPETRAMERPNAIGYKLAGKTSTDRKGKKWHLLDLESEADLTRALQIFDKAYRLAGDGNSKSDAPTSRSKSRKKAN
jgi:hypothetical protein